jgi:Protein of unknown function (DUF2924)/Transposase DDE domain group 1
MVTPSLSLKPGARLVREWRGRTHTVTVTEDGFEYGGTSYPSLTKIANKPSGKEVRGHLRRIVRCIRAHWPTTKITIRGDGHNGRRDVMDWCGTTDSITFSGCPATRFSPPPSKTRPTISAPVVRWNRCSSTGDKRIAACARRF